MPGEQKKPVNTRITLLTSPHWTLYYFALASLEYVGEVLNYFLSRKKILITFLFLFHSFVIMYFTPGVHQPYVATVEELVTIGAWWVFLGILSSIGLGTGLHTFVLYLGPHIAKVTFVAYECSSTQFETYGAEAFLCPSTLDPNFQVTLWNILRKVQFEAFMWGAGTAIGELPPYFVARAARLAGEKVAELEEIETITQEPTGLVERVSTWVKKTMFSLLGNLGFVGIMLFASIPNPLFDLAGITCGHFLVPFWTFFGATLIGKAVIKSHIQTVFTIFISSKTLMDLLVEIIEKVAPPLKQPIDQFLSEQRSKFHRGGSQFIPEKSALSYLWDGLIFVIIAYFVVSVINATAQSYHAKKEESQREKKERSGHKE